jgi:hypothetical protein
VHGYVSTCACTVLLRIRSPELMSAHRRSLADSAASASHELPHTSSNDSGSPAHPAVDSESELNPRL